MVDSSPLHFDAAMANREARRCGTGTSSGAARSCGTASPQDIDAQCVRRCPEGFLLLSDVPSVHAKMAKYALLTAARRGSGPRSARRE